MKKILAAAAVAATGLTATTAMATEGCDTIMTNDGGFAMVKHIEDTTYWVWVQEGYISEVWSGGYNDLLGGAYAIHTVCNMPSGSTYFPGPSYLATLEDIGDGNHVGYWSGVTPDNSLILD